MNIIIDRLRGLIEGEIEDCKMVIFHLNGSEFNLKEGSTDFKKYEDCIKNKIIDDNFIIDEAFLVKSIFYVGEDRIINITRDVENIIMKCLPALQVHLFIKLESEMEKLKEGMKSLCTL